MVKFKVVHLIHCLGLEPLGQQRELVVINSYLHCVKNGPERSGRNKPTLALVFILEERLQQETSVLNVSSNARQRLVQVLLFFVVKHVPRIQNGGSLELSYFLEGVLLQIFFCENSFNSLIELNVVYSVCITGSCEHFFQ